MGPRSVTFYEILRVLKLSNHGKWIVIAPVLSKSSLCFFSALKPEPDSVFPPSRGKYRKFSTSVNVKPAVNIDFRQISLTWRVNIVYQLTPSLVKLDVNRVNTLGNALYTTSRPSLTLMTLNTV